MGDFSYLDMGSKWGDEFTSVAKYKDYINELKIATLEGEMNVSVGDWVIKGIKGEFYPCKPDIFEKTYERVE